MIAQPAPKRDVLAKREAIVAGLRALLPASGVIADTLRLKPYETDGLSAYRQPPMVVALPETTEQVAAVMAFLHHEGVRVVPRGAGTSLSGGALPMADSVVLGMMRMNRILEIDFADRCATVQAGVTNVGITQAVSADGFFYAPDPSSQLACMIGGNVGMNSGGAHCLRYGVTANNLLGLKIVTVDGQIVDIGGAHLDAAGYDWLGLLTGSEGQLAVVTEVTVRILRSPEGQRAMLAAFRSNEVAGACVDAIIASGIIPVALEFMDRPAIHACETFAHAGYPLDAEAMLIIEVEGSVAEQDALLGHIKSICEPFDPISLRISASAEESSGDLEGAKRRVRRGRPDQPGLFVHGRHDPHQPAARGAAPHSGDERVLRPRSGQHFSCRRRQSAPAHHVRRQRSRQFLARRRIWRGGAETVRGSGRLPDRRARGRGGKARPDARAVHAHRTRPAAADQDRFRSGLAAQPEQGVSVAGSCLIEPPDEPGVAAEVANARRDREPLLVCGAGSKSAMLRPVQAARTLSARALSGITFYAPKELVISARAGTLLRDIEATVAENRQHLIAEPPDLGTLLGSDAPQTLGGVVATNLSGPRRVAWGAMRDHVMGVRAVSGRAEVIRSGGRVLKNVTGLDLCKLLTGSHGTLGILTEVTLKVLPAPERVGTLVWRGLDAGQAVRALAAALGSPYAVCGAAFLPEAAAARLPALGVGGSATLARIEDFAESVSYRCGRLSQELQEFGAGEILDDAASRPLWSAVRDAQPLVGLAGAIWRVSVRPSAGPAVAEAVARAFAADWFFDWGGGLVWIAGPATQAAHRAVAEAARAAAGTWLLLRGPESLRAAVDVLPPEPDALRAITARVKAAFDPDGILNPGRMYAGL